MKFILILACLVIYVAQSQGQRPQCKGLPSRQDCNGGRDEGNSRGRHCGASANNRMWYYNSRTRQCVEMRYRGCGGNNNRYCSKVDCDRHCPRRN